MTKWTRNSSLLLTRNSLRLILNTCDKFEEYSSLKLSVEKCQACWIGSAKGTQDAPINCNWVNLVEDKVLTPGVHMSYDVTLAEKFNFAEFVYLSERSFKNLGK